MDELEVVRQLQSKSAEFRHSGLFQSLSNLLDNASEIILQKRDYKKVVLCKDCKKWNYVARRMAGLCHKHCTYTAHYDFCSYGERKDNEI